MPDIALLIGAAGCGKTTRLLETMDKAIERGGLDPRQIGFVSFTRAARGEAASRAAARYDLKPSDLEQHGWFKTIHAIAYRQLEAKDSLLAPGKETVDWLSENLQEEVSGTQERTADEFEEVKTSTPADVALGLWGVARSRLVPFDEVYERAWRCDDRTPDLTFCRRVIKRYEEAKRMQHRCDFTDLLGRFSGWSFTLDGPQEAPECGEVPQVPAWIIDEAQDNSALVDAVAQRLTRKSRWVWLAGDPFQSVYGFGGGDPALFQSWFVHEKNKHILSKSWRCPRPIVELGEHIITGCSDYFDRGVQPADHDGGISSAQFNDGWEGDAKPGDSWLMLARTNFQARRIIGKLNAAGVPWVPTKGNGGWAAPQRNKALAGLLGLSKGEVVFPEEWRQIVKMMPSKTGGKELLTRGTKTQWETIDVDDSVYCTIDQLHNWGATPELVSHIQTGRWVELVDKGAEFKAAVDRYGLRDVLDPKIRVGTVHSAKGLEADNVALLTTTSMQVNNSRQDEMGDNEERRVAYVAVTRTRRNLLILRERTAYEMEIPA